MSGPNVHVAPDLDAMIAWLSRVSLATRGAVPSWISETHPGAPYPEAAGIVLRVLAAARPDDRALPVVARWLERQVLPSGLVARGDVAYAFDTGIALRGLLAARDVGVEVDAEVLSRMVAALEQSIEDCRATYPERAEERWSTRWSCHQLKNVEALLAWDGRARARIDALAAELLPLEHEGRFAIAPNDSRSYVHASCYALEGVLALDPSDARLMRGAAWLASIQEPSGALPSWIGEGEDAHRRPTDVIAQAVRLWALVDPKGRADAIERGLGELARRQDASGGLVYLSRDAMPRDVNVWCTAFAIEALCALEKAR